jgi:hypothetical protein
VTHSITNKSSYNTPDPSRSKSSLWYSHPLKEIKILYFALKKELLTVSNTVTAKKHSLYADNSFTSLYSLVLETWSVELNIGFKKQRHCKRFDNSDQHGFKERNLQEENTTVPDIVLRLLYTHTEINRLNTSTVLK